MGDSFGSKLVESDQANVSRELGCCQRVYSFSLTNGSRVEASGFWSFAFQENERPPILFVDYMAFCGPPTMQVQFSNSPMLTIVKKSLFSRSILILNEDNAQVLKIKRPHLQLPGTEFQIVGDNDIHIGTIRKDWMEYELFYPSNLDSKYKAALLASCIYVDFLNNR